MTAQIPLYTAFFAGLISFLSPCVLPLVPGYLSYISGVSSDQMRAGADAETRRRVMVNASGFVLGFSLIFIALGASATALGQLMLAQLEVLSKIAGVVIIVFGLHTMGLLRIKWLYMEKRVQLSSKPLGLLGALVVGMAFGFGWTPCIGPILASILAIAATQETVGQGISLLAVYSLGLGIPFLLAGLAINQFFALFDRLKRHMRIIEIVSGLLLIGVGLLMFTNNLTMLSGFFQQIPLLNKLAI
jgi:cytochrome c-type biogenesis protein